MKPTNKRLFELVCKSAKSTYIQAINDHLGTQFLSYIQDELKSNVRRLKALLDGQKDLPSTDKLEEILKVSEKACSTENRQLLVGHLEYIHETLEDIQNDWIKK
ncbi:hypothetical protein C4H01_RS23295 [Vibrio parahaemolyticus]|nr:hypothetical protein [Vibrio parahaemolyticus]EJG0994659.1 hypothetical protein [Vibrio parahaemolyticus]EJG1004351.1 hypothetical protein [Vibrio parahaemolyticus]EJG1052777.1 hypothetical protein [Vibrio parahaemolyticus]